MNSAQIAGIIRHLLTTFGGVLVTKGVTDEATLSAIVGGIVAAFGLVWSYISKRKKPDLE